MHRHPQPTKRKPILNQSHYEPPQKDVVQEKCTTTANQPKVGKWVRSGGGLCFIFNTYNMFFKAPINTFTPHIPSTGSKKFQPWSPPSWAGSDYFDVEATTVKYQTHDSSSSSCRTRLASPRAVLGKPLICALGTDHTLALPALRASSLVCIAINPQYGLIGSKSL